MNEETTATEVKVKETVLRSDAKAEKPPEPTYTVERDIAYHAPNADGVWEERLILADQVLPESKLRERLGSMLADHVAHGSLTLVKRDAPAAPAVAAPAPTPAFVRRTVSAPLPADPEKKPD